MATPDYVIYVMPEKACPWCEKAKELLTSKGLDYEIRSIYDVYEKEVYVPMAPVFVPQVYRKGMLIGGYQQLEKWFV